MSVLLLNTYDLGRQPFGVASPVAWLRRAGIDATAIDLSRDRLDVDEVARASMVAFYLPMHTATRLALPVIDRVRAVNPSAVVCAYGLYAPLNESLLRARGVSVILGPEAEAELVRAAGAAGAAGPPSRQEAASTRSRRSSPDHARAKAGALPKLAFIPPDRSALPRLDRYASLRMPDGTRKVTGATDASRGCKHRCRHCPIVPVYDGQFRVVPVDVVLADVRAQVEQGAQHITFNDPDFLNGPTHARRLIEGLRRQHPGVTYDVTIKIEHLLKHRDLLPMLVDTGCLFVTSAVEAVDDRVLQLLEKGHTRADFIAAAGACATAGLTLVPTFVAFTPWTTPASYRELLDVVEELDLVEHVAPVQWGIRLLVTWQSRLLDLPEIRAAIGDFDSRTLTYPWKHEDSRVDELQREVIKLADVRTAQSRKDLFAAVRSLADARDRQSPAREITKSPHPRTSIPYLDEPWYC